MKTAGIVISMGLGAAAGAVAVLMMPRTNSVRKFAAKTAGRVEDAAQELGDRIGNTIDL